jgi:hypothetical protein
MHCSVTRVLLQYGAIDVMADVRGHRDRGRSVPAVVNFGQSMVIIDRHFFQGGIYQ